MKKSHFSPKLMMAIFVATVMILSALVIALPGMEGREYGMNPAATSSSNIQPNPTLNTNVTWSTFYQGWSTLEYTNGTGNLTLNAQESAFYNNPITINPANIQTNALKGPLGTSGIYWNETFSAYGGNAGLITTEKGQLLYETQSNDESSKEGRLYWNISTAYLPSLNPQYDYVTIVESTTQTGTGNTAMNFGISNGSTYAGLDGICAGIKNETTYASPNTGIPTTGTVFISIQASDFVKNLNSGYMQIGLSQNVPETTTNGSLVISSTILGLAITSNPITLGTYTNATGNHPITAMATRNGQDITSQFAPSFPWSSITNNSYSVAVSQPLQNLSTQQSAINTLGYIEQVEYQGQFNLPTAPDLSYGTANLTEHFNVSTSQTQVLDINGVSYLSTISGKNNTVQLLSSVNPNSQTQFLQIVDYTQSQWTSISSPPGIFTLAGIEYYWEEFIIAILAIVGVGAGAASRHASNLRKVK